MMNPDPDKILKTIRASRQWWIVRGEQGFLWRHFLHGSIVATGSMIKKRFDLNGTPDERDISLTQQGCVARKLEVDWFIDRIEEGDVVLCPDAGSRSVLAGVVGEHLFAADDEDEPYWIQRECSWYPEAIAVPDGLLRCVEGYSSQAGTVFYINDRVIKRILECLPS